jgi:raffinose/stachyose/melibiose transport system permease protein
MMQENKRANRIILEVFSILLFVLMLFPIFLVLINAAKSNSQVISAPLALPDNLGQIISNVEEIFLDENLRYGSSLLASLIITVLSIVVINLVSAQAAWVLVRTKSKLAQIIFFLFVASMVIPFQIVMLPLVSWFRVLFDTLGLRLLRTYPGMILAYLGFGLPLTLFLFHGFIKGIPYELEEAARIDGCTKPQTFYIIVFPLLKPINATAMILNGIWIWNDYLLPLLVLGKGNDIQTIPLSVASYAGAFVIQWDMLLTAILLSMIPVIIVFLLAQKQIIRGMVSGSIK